MFSSVVPETFSFCLIIIRLSFIYLSLGSPCKNRPATNRVAVARPSCAQRSPGVPRPGRRRRCVPLCGRCRSVPLRRQGSLGESRPSDMTFETSAIRSCRLLPAGIHRVMGEGAVGQRAEHQQRGHHWGSARRAASIERSSRCIRASTREVAEDGMSSARKRRETPVHSVACSGLRGVEGLQ
jgi:hypothetical protein